MNTPNGLPSDASIAKAFWKSANFSKGLNGLDAAYVISAIVKTARELDAEADASVVTDESVGVVKDASSIGFPAGLVYGDLKQRAEQLPVGTKLYAAQHAIKSAPTPQGADALDGERWRWARKNLFWSYMGKGKVRWVLELAMPIPDIHKALNDDSVALDLDAAVDAARDEAGDKL